MNTKSSPAHFPPSALQRLHSSQQDKSALPIWPAPSAPKNASKKRNHLRYPIPISTPRFKKGCRNASRLPSSRCATCAKTSAAVAPSFSSAKALRRVQPARDAPESQIPATIVVLILEASAPHENRQSCNRH